jgi:hypothetical protein
MDHVPVYRFLGHPPQCGVRESQLLTQIQHLLRSQVTDDPSHTTQVFVRPCREKVTSYTMTIQKHVQDNTLKGVQYPLIIHEVLVAMAVPIVSH